VNQFEFSNRALGAAIGYLISGYFLNEHNGSYSSGRNNSSLNTSPAISKQLYSMIKRNIYVFIHRVGYKKWRLSFLG
jgi:hypothetical protein